MARYLVNIHRPNYNAFLLEDKAMSKAIGELNDELIAVGQIVYPLSDASGKIFT